MLAERSRGRALRAVLSSRSANAQQQLSIVATAADYEGNTPLHLAVQSAEGARLSVEALLSVPGVSCLVPNKAGKTPFQLATTQGRRPVAPAVADLLRKRAAKARGAALRSALLTHCESGGRSLSDSALFSLPLSLSRVIMHATPAGLDSPRLPASHAPRPA